MSAGATTPTTRRYVLALSAAILAAALDAFGLAAPVGDTLERWLAPLPATQPVAPSIVLTIDADDPWPWRNERLADLLDRLREAGVRGVGLDLPVRTDAADPEGDARLARTLLDNRVVMGVALSTTAEGAPLAQLPPVEFAGAARLGHRLLVQDRDGRLRQHLSYVVAADGVRWPSLPQALVQPGNAVAVEGRSVDLWRIGITPAASAPRTLRAADVLAGRIGASQLHGHWVLVGLGDPSMQPRLPGPFGSAPLYPVEHEARALVALLQGATPRPLPAALQALLAMLLAGTAVLAGMANGGRDWRMPVALLGGLLASLALCAGLLGRQFWFAPGGTVAVLAGALLAWAAFALRLHLRERRISPGLVPRQRLEAALEAARHSRRPHALLLFDIGAATSVDEAVVPSSNQADACQLAQLLREWARRPGDVAAQLDDGRLALLLPGTPAHAAEHILDEIRQAAARRGATAVGGSVHGCNGERCECAGRLGATALRDIAPPPA